MLGLMLWSVFLMTITRLFIIRCLNLGSYNYLGFAAADEYCTPRATECLKKYSAITCSTRVEGGTTALHIELEQVVADFVGKSGAMVTGMGYVTNSVILPVLIKKNLPIWRKS